MLAKMRLYNRYKLPNMMQLSILNRTLRLVANRRMEKSNMITWLSMMFPLFHNFLMRNIEKHHMSWHLHMKNRNNMVDRGVVVLLQEDT
jgi:hypothetical protein